jgi:hypothetical protein
LTLEARLSTISGNIEVKLLANGKPVEGGSL